MQEIAVVGTGALDECEVLGIADGEVDLDGVELRDGGEDGLRADEVADLRRGLAGDSGDEGANLSEAEVDPGGVDSGLRCGDRGVCSGDVGFGLCGLLLSRCRAGFARWRAARREECRGLR